ncbi:hypothetical protein CGMCC3_g17878 [Colletotrichum fructicola]|nr:uncharacterized protein CGMCC3_g17878 [Colletotrichum fructicola]KAE9565947.1 hypothetical protein CGMCC3_g17878 [Colletotrichum fructicola]
MTRTTAEQRKRNREAQARHRKKVNDEMNRLRERVTAIERFAEDVAEAVHCNDLPQLMHLIRDMRGSSAELSVTRGSSARESEVVAVPDLGPPSEVPLVVQSLENLFSISENIPFSDFDFTMPTFEYPPVPPAGSQDLYGGGQFPMLTWNSSACFGADVLVPQVPLLSTP